jgi:cytochrome d ubiquinol oxidase subunit II
MDAFGLPSLWFLVMGLVMVCYVVLDGFDLGVGMLHPFARRDEDRRIFLNAIGPMWDGNGVWLVVLVGASLAGFPRAYGTLGTALYIPFTLLLIGIVFRAVAIEFRSKEPSRTWRSFWDWAFALASLGISIILGVILGNFVVGIPMDEELQFVGTTRGLFNPYALMIGALAIVLFSLHGAIYLLMKTEGDLHARIRRWLHPLLVLYILSFVLATMVTLIYEPHMAEQFRLRPYLFVVAFLNLLAVANVPREIHLKRDVRAFISSAVAMCLLLCLFAIGQYPVLIRNFHPEMPSMTILNAAASRPTLIYLLIIVAIGIPLVLTYTINTYRIFKGKVKIHPTSY